MIPAGYEKHYPVMLKEVLENLRPEADKTYVDATFGDGGYSEAILQSANCRLIAIDRDPNVITRAQELKQKYGDRFDFRRGCFGDFSDIVTENIDGAVFDIGVSSMQLDEADRGFSFSKDAPLDMRMSCQGITAADIVNTYSETELADLIYKYGEEKYSRLFAKYIEEFGGVCDWSNSNQPKCFCYWDLSTDDFRTTFGGTMKLPLDYATNKKVLEDAMSFIDVDNFKKYVAKVKDSHILMNDKLLDDFGDGDDLPHIEEEKKKPINIDNDDEDDEFDESLLDYDF